MHGSSGIRPNLFRWADELLGLGVAVFIVDSFGGRGIIYAGAHHGFDSHLAPPYL